jgi:hypothetical protein
MDNEWPENDFEQQRTMSRRWNAHKDDVWVEYFEKLIAKLDSMEGWWEPMVESSSGESVTLSDGRKVDFLTEPNPSPELNWNPTEHPSPQ